MTSPEPILEQALQHHRRGQLQQAAMLYMRLLQQEPGHAWALHWLGVLGCQAGRFQEAAALLQQAIASDPAVPLFYNNLGNAFKALERLPAAIEQYQRALALDPALTDAHNNLGNAYRQQGRLEEAAACYRRAIALEPGFAEPLHNLGLVLQEQGQPAEALPYLRRALQQKEAPEIHFSLGNALKAQSQYQAAVQHYQRAVGLDPRFARAYNNLAHAWQLLGQADTAIFFYHKAIECQPDCADFYNNLGNAWQEKQEPEEALKAYQRALALEPDMDEAHNNLGNILYELDRCDEAEAAYRRALELNPVEATVYANLGKTLRAGDRFDEAQACYEKALALQPGLDEALLNLGNICLERDQDWQAAQDRFEQVIAHSPDHAEARFNRSLMLLLQGRLEEGFREYEWRWRCHNYRRRPGPELFAWDGQDLQGRTLAVFAEQGYGDMLQFARYLPLAAERNGRVIVVCQQPLVRLMQAVPGVAEVFPAEELGGPPVFDYCEPVVSLARVFGTTLATIPASLPFLTVPQPVRVPVLKGPGLKVGLVWASGYRPQPDFLRLYRAKSCPLPVMAALRDVPGVDCYSLQVGPDADDLSQHGLAGQITDLSPHIADFADTAALVAQLDLVITVDTAVAHLAGGLGKPVWVLLPALADWRWLLAREDSPWYPGVMRLFRQQQPGDWEEVIGRVQAALAVLTVQKDNHPDP